MPSNARRTRGLSLTHLFLLLNVTLTICQETEDGTIPGEIHDGEVAVSGVADDNMDAAQSLMKCYNAVFGSKSWTFQQFMSGKPSQSLRLNRVWWSKKSTTMPLTIFTIADFHRLEALAAQCRSYPGGPLVAAVYLPLIQRKSSAGNVSSTGEGIAVEDVGQEPTLTANNTEELNSATAKLDALFQELEGTQQQQTMTTATTNTTSASAGGEVPACAIRLLLLYELVADDVMAALMPINALRNAALLAASTPLVSMVDVDLSASSGLAARVMAGDGEGSRAAAMLKRAERGRTGWVLPAWDTHRRLNFSARNAVADAVVAVSPDRKGVLKDMWRGQNAMYPFASDVYRAGHHATDYDRWLRSDKEYKVNYQPGYEPWFIAARGDFPVYDARFRGYSWNKVVHVQYAAAANFTFRVVPDAWLVHRPHEPTASCTVCSKEAMKHAHRAEALEKSVTVYGKRRKARDAFLGRIKSFYRSAGELMKQKKYEPVRDEATRYCRAVLPWWRGVDQGEMAPAENATMEATTTTTQSAGSWLTKWMSGFGR